MSTTSHLVTADELMKLSGIEHRYELIKGELLTMSPSGSDHGVVTMNLSVLVASYIKAHQLGLAFAAETGFKLESNPDTVLAPDFAFIRREQPFSSTPGYIEMAPDLVVEVISSTKTRRKAESKARQWLSFGVHSVWLVSCPDRTVEVCSASGSRRLFWESDELVDDAVIPGFRTIVAAIFT